MTMRIIPALLVLFIVSSAVVYGDVPSLPRKNLAGGPDEFDLHSMPDPSDGTLTSQAAVIPVDLSQVTGSQEGRGGALFVWESQLPVDSQDTFIFSVASPIEKHLKLTLTDPHGHHVSLHRHASKGTFPVGGETVPVTNYVFQKPKIGQYTLHIKGSAQTLLTTKRASLMTAEPEAYITWFNYNEDVVLNSQLNSYYLTSGGDIGLTAYIADTEGNLLAGNDHDSISSAEMYVTLPDNSEVSEVMVDDGLHADADPDDGIYGAMVTASHTGVYTLRTVFSGVTANGTAFIRSSQHLVTVVTDNAEYTGEAAATLDANQRILVNVAVDAPVNMTYKAYAEVWGTAPTSKSSISTIAANQIPICWVGGVVDVIVVDEQHVIQLEVDTEWVRQSQAVEPFILRNIRLQDLGTSIPISTASEIPIDSNLNLRFSSLQAPVVVTERMRVGIRPKEFFADRAAANTTALSGQLILLHGYCSQQNPWQQSASQFLNGNYYLNPGASISNDQFALRVDAFARGRGISNYAVIGHSQGGLVALHLKNFYWSGLDSTTGTTPPGRLLQSVGSPFQGCSAAGSAASLGKIFGVGCGVNQDLTVDGALMWLAGISTHNRQQLSWWTSTYKRNQFFGDYCNLAINLILNFPNDGTTELDRAGLPGGVNMGNTESQCHTSGMKYQAQYLDAARNSYLNSQAVRF